MRIWQEMSYAEIASVLGKSEASCKMTFGRAMKKLREIVPAEILMTLLLFGITYRNN
jgi:DNA-directed RNA polymerase specialized sigma24 family protein